MTNKEIKKEVKSMGDFTKKVTFSKEAALQFLISTGMYTKKGLKERFR